MVDKERVVHQGVTFTRYPASELRHLRTYYWPSRTYREKGVKALHVEMWKDAHGDVPPGWHVHHRNHDSLDNRLENLECLPGSDHRKHHAAEGCGRQDDEHMRRLQELAKAWHASPEGLAWHREHGRQTWVGRERVSVGPCAGCGNPVSSYMTNTGGGNNRWCSHGCFQRTAEREKWYRVDATCPVCGASFQQKRTGRPVNCSKSCAAKARHRDEKGRLVALN